MYQKTFNMTPNGCMCNSMPSTNNNMSYMSNGIPNSDMSYMNNSIPTNMTRSMPYMGNKNNDRLIGGGFLGPFILGGITGGLLAPTFYPRPYPVPVPPYPPYPPYPIIY